jgi:hypothetical protein
VRSMYRYTWTLRTVYVRACTVTRRVRRRTADAYQPLDRTLGYGLCRWGAVTCTRVRATWYIPKAGARSRWLCRRSTSPTPSPIDFRATRRYRPSVLAHAPGASLPTLHGSTAPPIYALQHSSILPCNRTTTSRFIAFFCVVFHRPHLDNASSPLLGRLPRAVKQQRPHLQQNPSSVIAWCRGSARGLDHGGARRPSASGRRAELQGALFRRQVQRRRVGVVAARPPVASLPPRRRDRRARAHRGASRPLPTRRRCLFLP